MSGDKLSRPVVYVTRAAKASNLHLEEARLRVGSINLIFPP